MFDPDAISEHFKGEEAVTKEEQDRAKMRLEQKLKTKKNEQYKTKLRSDALAVLEEIMLDPDSPSGSRVRAAETILKTFDEEEKTDESDLASDFLSAISE